MIPSPNETQALPDVCRSKFVVRTSTSPRSQASSPQFPGSTPITDHRSPITDHRSLHYYPMPTFQFLNDFTQANFSFNQKDEKVVQQVRGLHERLLSFLKG